MFKKKKVSNDNLCTREIKDYSKKCTRDDAIDKMCLFCTNYKFPIGCKLQEFKE